MMTEPTGIGCRASAHSPPAATEPMPTHNPPADRAALAWLARRHSGHWTADDAHDHAAWLAADAAHPTAWQRAEAMWQELAGLRPFAANELHALHAHHLHDRASTGLAGWRTGLALAGVGALAFGLLAFGLPGSLAPAQMQQTARGEQRTLTLADGSTIELNTATQVRIDYGPACRCIALSGGEAVFRVAHGDPRRFEVTSGQGRIRDIGTEFWVRDEAGKTSVAVLAGEIEATPPSKGETVRLRAGNRLAWDRNGHRIDTATAPLADLLAWREGAIVFRDAPLTEVVAEFSRYHALRIDLDARLRKYHLSGKFRGDDLDGLLKLLQSAYPVIVRRPSSDRLSIEIRGS